MFSNFSLNAKMKFVFSVCALMLAFIGGLSHYDLKQISADYNHVSEVNLPKALLAEEMKNFSDKSLSLLLQVNTPGNTEKEINRLAKKLQDNMGLYDKTEKQYAEGAFVDGEKELYEKVNRDWQGIHKYIDQALPLAMSAKPEDEAKFGELYQGEFKDFRHKFYEGVDALIKFQKDQADSWVVQAKTSSRRFSQLGGLVSAFGFFFSLVTGFLFSHAISRTLNKIASSLSNGATEVTEASSAMSGSTNLYRRQCLRKLKPFNKHRRR